MKTFADLLNLIAEETRKSRGMTVEYRFQIDTLYHWLSMFRVSTVNLPGIDEVHKEEIFYNVKIETEADIQAAYWQVWNAGRSRDEAHQCNRKAL